MKALVTLSTLLVCLDRTWCRPSVPWFQNTTTGARSASRPLPSRLVEFKPRTRAHAGLRLYTSISYFKSLPLPLSFCSSLQIQTSSSRQSASHQLSRCPQVPPSTSLYHAYMAWPWLGIPLFCPPLPALVSKEAIRQLPGRDKKTGEASVAQKIVTPSETCLYRHAFMETCPHGNTRTSSRRHAFTEACLHGDMRHRDTKTRLHRDALTDTRPCRKSNGNVFRGRPLRQMGRKAKA